MKILHALLGRFVIIHQQSHGVIPPSARNDAVVDALDPHQGIQKTRLALGFDGNATLGSHSTDELADVCDGGSDVVELALAKNRPEPHVS
ncbi:hypothetical protein RRF57_009881 [Xylaria bambusicola]|uniref:Uncharacterized protein n=1 Tax=Xylaria bambusicola TaxID=326684 RepID=A0AAN7URL8_9PEZI